MCFRGEHQDRHVIAKALLAGDIIILVDTRAGIALEKLLDLTWLYRCIDSNPYRAQIGQGL